MTLASMSSMAFGPGVGSALIRVGADFRNLHARTAAAMGVFRGQMQAGARSAALSSRGVRGLSDELDRSAQKARVLTNVMKGAGLALGALVLAGSGLAIKAAIDFESAFAGVRKTVEASEATLGRLRGEFLQLSRDIPVAATELARIGEAAGALGVPVDSIKEFTEVVSTIGTTTNVTTEEAAAALGQLSNVLNMTQDDYQRFAATLVDLGNKGASTETQILEITRRMGASAKLFGLATPQIMGLASAVANLGMQPQLAASSMQRLIMRLNSVVGGAQQLDKTLKQVGISEREFVTVVDKGGDALEKFAAGTGFTSKELKKMRDGLDSLGALQQAVGVTDREFQRLQRTAPEKIIERLFLSMGQMDAADRTTFISRLLGPAATAGGGVGMQTMMLGLADSAARNLTPALRDAAVAWQDQTAAMVEAEKRYATVASQLGMLRNEVQFFLIEAGTGALPFVADLIGKVREAIPAIASAIGGFFSAVQPALQRVGDAFSALFGTLTDILFDWGGGGRADGMAESLGGIATIVSNIANWVALAAESLNSMLSNPVMAGLVKMAALLGAIALAVKTMAALRGLFLGAAGGLANLLSFGRYGGAATALDPSAQQQMAAATTQQTAANQQVAAAKSMNAAASRMGGAATAGALTGAGMAGALAQQRVMGPTGPGQFMMMGGAAQQLTAGAVGARNVTPGATSLFGRAAAGVRGGLSGAAGLIGAGVMGISRLFWPVFIASLVADLAAAPIGELIRSSGGSQRVADAWGRGFFEGLGATFEAVTRGTDAFVGRPETVEFGRAGKVDLGVLKTLHAADRSLFEGEAGERFGEIMDRVTQAVAAAEAEGTTTVEQGLALRDLGKWLAEVDPGTWTRLAAYLDSQAYIPHPRARRSLAQFEGQEAAQAYPDVPVDVLERALERAALSTEDFARRMGFAMQGEATGAFGNLADLEKNRDAQRAIAAAQSGVLERAGMGMARQAMASALHDAGVDVPFGRLANVDDQTMRDLAASLSTDQTGMPPGWMAAVARHALGAGRAIETPEGILDWARSMGEARNELDLINDTLDETAEKDPAGMALARALDLEALEGATTRADKARQIRRVADLFFPEAADIKGTQKERVDRYWTQLMELSAFAAERLAIPQQAEIAERMTATLTSSLTQQLRSGDVIESLSTQSAYINDLLFDGVGVASDEVVSRITGALADSLAAVLADMKGLKGDRLKRRLGGAADAINELLGIGGTMYRVQPSRAGLRPLVMASIRDQVMEAAEGSEKEQAALMKDLRKRFPGMGIPKADDFKKLTEQVKGPDATRYYAILQRQAREGLDEVDSVVGTKLGGIIATASSFETPMRNAMGNVGNAINEPVDAAADRLGGSVNRIGSEMGRLAYMARRAEMVAADLEAAAARAEAAASSPRPSPSPQPGPAPGPSPSPSGRDDRDVGGGRNLRFDPMAALPAMSGGPTFPDVGGPGGGDSFATSDQNIYVQNMTVLGDSDEESLLYQFEFMAPAT